MPTTAERGYPAAVVQQWFGLVVPKGSQNEITDRLAAAFSSALAQKETVDWIAVQGGEPPPIDGEQFRFSAQRESMRWRKVINAARIQLQ